MRLKDIVITNPLAFSACQLVQAKDETRKYLTGVFIEPSGRVTATDGHHAVVCDNVVEPFDGEAIILKAKPLSVRQSKRCTAVIHFDVDGEAFIECRDNPVFGGKAKPRTFISAFIIKGDFPNLQAVFPKFDAKDKGITAIAFNSSLISNIASRLDPYSSTTKMRMKGEHDPIEITFSSSECEGIKLIVMPQRV